ncbi:MAG: hypothetical protein A4E42_01772 [Methanoregulaceae archaeon PtaU1.Bin222]|nr:MAG: hypothetical protein A4E42_01772 [Methanoregulaceae archaeon PtaU1.Bin222]
MAVGGDSDDRSIHMPQIQFVITEKSVLLELCEKCCAIRRIFIHLRSNWKPDQFINRTVPEKIST